MMGEMADLRKEIGYGGIERETRDPSVSIN